MSEDSPVDDSRDKCLEPDGNGFCYLGCWHFDERMQTVAKRLLQQQGTFLERRGFMLATMMMVALMGVVVFLLPSFPFGVFGILITVVAIWIGVRAGRFVRRIVDERLCLRCGYPLKKSPVDDAGWGRCPECGRQFNVGEYRRPPKGYRRIQSALLEPAPPGAADAPPSHRY